MKHNGYTLIVQMSTTTSDFILLRPQVRAQSAGYFENAINRHSLALRLSVLASFASTTILLRAVLQLGRLRNKHPTITHPTISQLI